MKKFLILILVPQLLWAQSLSSYRDKVIYGDDNREEIYNSTHPHAKLAQATAALIEDPLLNLPQDGQIQIMGKSLIEDFSLCSYERFAEQTATALCSGFLVGPDLLLTAGHCLERDGTCAKKQKWVFNYQLHSAQDKFIYVKADDIYSCAKVLESEQGHKNDYALIRLDRVVKGRKPLALSQRPRLSKDTALFMIGHPLGMPAKITAGAHVRQENSTAFFTADLDAYAGNSGSAVFNEENGEVEGILVSGEADFLTDTRRDCQYSNVCTGDSCEGESVQKISHIKYFKTHPL